MRQYYRDLPVKLKLVAIFLAVILEEDSRESRLLALQSQVQNGRTDFGSPKMRIEKMKKQIFSYLPFSTFNCDNIPS